jgi:dTDP-4-dehydrorhamnose reductase
MTKRCLVIGASGQVGRAVVAAFSDWDVFEAQRTPTTREQFRVDLTDPESIAAALTETKPHLVVVAGAWTWVDGAEDDPDECMETNVEGPAQVARWCAEHDATIVYYSTDHVFDGTDNPHDVDDPLNPLNTYARSKVEGEQRIRELTDRHVIIRTAWVYGPDQREKNFAIRLVRSLESGEPVKVPADQWGTPTYAPDLAEVTKTLVERGLTGIYQVVGPDFLSRIDLSKKVCEAFGLDPDLLEPIDTASLGQRADRPLKVRMSTATIDAVMEDPIRGVDAGLEALARWYETWTAETT